MRGVVGIGDGSGRTWHGGPPVNDLMWVRPGRGFEDDEVTPTPAHLARNLSLHEFAEGDPVTLEWMHSGRGANMLQIVYREFPSLFGLFVVAYTHPQGLQIPTTWKVLKFTQLPSPVYEDLGYPAGEIGGYGGFRFMAVAQNALYTSSAVYYSGTWRYPYTYEVGLYNDGEDDSNNPFFCKHNQRVYAVFKTDTSRITVYLLNTDATSTVVGHIDQAQISDEEIKWVSSMTPDSSGRIYIHMAGRLGDVADDGRMFAFDVDLAAGTGFETSPAYIADGWTDTAGEGVFEIKTFEELRYFHRVGDAGYAIAYDDSTNQQRLFRTTTPDSPTLWADVGSIRSYRDTMGLVPFVYAQHIFGGEFDGDHYWVDEDETVWITPGLGDKLYTSWFFGGLGAIGAGGEPEDSFNGDAAGNTWTQGAIHYGGSPPVADGVFGDTEDPQQNFSEMGYFIRQEPGGGGTIIASIYTFTNTEEVTISRRFHGGIRIGRKVYVSLGVAHSFSDPSYVFSSDPPGGLFTYDLDTELWERFLPVEALGGAGGCVMMMAHNVTEAAAV